MRLVKLDPIVKLSRKSTNYRFHASATGCFDAENAVDFDDLKPKTIGWGGCRERTLLALPSCVLNLVATEEDGGRVKLHWDKPVDGDRPAAYNILY